MLFQASTSGVAVYSRSITIIIKECMIVVFVLAMCMQFSKVHLVQSLLCTNSAFSVTQMHWLPLVQKHLGACRTASESDHAAGSPM